MLKSLVLLAMLVAGPAAATQEYILPTLFDVEGVASDDVLNIRDTPTASAPIIGTLAPDATRIEVTGLDRSGQWGLVNTGERAGWVSMRFLAYRTDVWEAGRLPEGLSCSGTEPFWSFHAEDGGLVWSEPENKLTLPGLSVMDRGVFRDPRRALHAHNGDETFFATITPAQCSDGMSDMSFGLEAMVILQRAGQSPRLYSGCCRIGG